MENIWIKMKNQDLLNHSWKGTIQKKQIKNKNRD